MFAIERLEIIKKILIEKKTAEIPYIRKILDVTDVTIRRDLDKLEKEGFLIKTYGGAILNTASQKTDSVQNIVFKDDQPSEETNQIGLIAASMINEDDIVFISGGIIGLVIAQNLKNKSNIKVLTNDIFIASELYNQVGINVLLTGGDLILGTGILTGGVTLKSLENIYLSKAFITVKGIHLEFGYTTDNANEVLLFSEISKISNELIIVAEHSKFDKVSYKKIANINQYKKIISSKEIPDKYKDYFYSNNIKIYTAYAIK